MRVLILASLVLLQSTDEELVRIAEWAKTQPENGPGAIGVGDEYFKSAKKYPKDRQKFLDQANEWWAKGWPQLDSFWKDKTRDTLRKIYAAPVSAVHPIQKQEWTTDGVVATSERVHSGNFAAKLPMPKGNPDGYHQPLKNDLKLPAGCKELEISAWVLADGTNSSDDDMKPLVSDAKGKLLSATGTPIQSDIPVWTKITQIIPCVGAVRLQVFFEFKSRQGIVFVDDVSIKCDGKELLPNGGFEK